MSDYNSIDDDTRRHLLTVALTGATRALKAWWLRRRRKRAAKRRAR